MDRLRRNGIRLLLAAVLISVAGATDKQRDWQTGKVLDSQRSSSLRSTGCAVFIAKVFPGCFLKQLHTLLDIHNVLRHLETRAGELKSISRLLCTS